jgi:hypothetical protein
MAGRGFRRVAVRGGQVGESQGDGLVAYRQRVGGRLARRQPIIGLNRAAVVRAVGRIDVDVGCRVTGASRHRRAERERTHEQGEGAGECATQQPGAQHAQG